MFNLADFQHHQSWFRQSISVHRRIPCALCPAVLPTMLNRPTRSILVVALTTVCLLVAGCYGRCAEPLPLWEQFEAKNTPYTAHLTLTNQNATNSCYSWIDGTNTNQIPLFTVQEVFHRGNQTQLIAGMNISVLYWTDTGYTNNLPAAYTNQQGVLAFLSWNADCRDANGTEIVVSSGSPFEMSECVRHMPWSNVSPDDRARLRQQQQQEKTGTTSPTVAPSTSLEPTAPPSEAVVNTVNAPSGAANLSLGMITSLFTLFWWALL